MNKTKLFEKLLKSKSKDLLIEDNDEVETNCQQGITYLLLTLIIIIIY